MTIQSTNAIEPIANYPMIIEGESSIFDEVDELIKQYDTKPLERAEIATSTKQLIERFNQLVEENVEQNLSLVREGLCHLLKLNIEEIQIEAIRSLKSFFQFKYLICDIKTDQLYKLISVEKKISEMILNHTDRCFPSKFIIEMLKVHKDIILRLWLIPYIVEDKENYAVFIKKNKLQIFNYAKKWIDILLKKSTKYNDIRNLIINCSQNINRIISISPVIAQKFERLILTLHLDDALILIGNVFIDFEDIHVAIRLYEENYNEISSLNNEKINYLKNNATHVLGTMYRNIHEYENAVKYHEIELEISLLLNNKSLEIKAYENFGDTYQCLAENNKAIEFYTKSLCISKDLNDKSKTAEIYRKIGISFQYLKSFENAIKYFNDSLYSFKSMKNLHGEWKTCKNLGYLYRDLKEINTSIDYFSRFLEIVKEYKNQEEEAIAYREIAFSYQDLEEFDKAIPYYEKLLKIDRAISYDDICFQIITRLRNLEEKEQSIAYKKIADAYQNLGEYRKSIQYNERALEIDKRSYNQTNAGITYGLIGLGYQSLGKYLKAIDYHKQSLRISHLFQNAVGREAAFANLGITSQSLGEYSKALAYHQRSLKMALEIKDKSKEGNAYKQIGIAQHSLGNLKEAILYYEKSKEISTTLNDWIETAKAYGNIGSAYDSLGNYEQSVMFHKSALRIFKYNQYTPGEGLAYCNIGNTFIFLKDHQQAIEHFEKALQIAKTTSDQDLESNIFFCLALAYEKNNDFVKAENYFRCSIDIYSNLQNDLGDNSQWKITIFEKQVKSYQRLENIFLQQNKIDSALEISENRRSRALVASISRKISEVGIDALSSSLTNLQIQEVVIKIQTTFVVYSLFFIEKEERYHITAWVIPSQGEITYYQLPWNAKSPLNEISNQINDLVKEVENLSSIKRGGSDELDFDLDDLDLEAELALLKNDPEVEKLAASKQAEKTKKDQNALKRLKEEKLRPWYDLLIAPLEKHLPAHGSSITIIPDGVLSQFPFGAFCDKQGTYLIEKYAISLAPSIKTLQLLHQLPQDYPLMSLVVGSPDTGNPKDQLEVADREAQTVATLINGSQLLSKKQATISHVSQQMQEARFIHLACHGLAEKKYDKYSVFEGLFKLAPDETTPNTKLEHGHLYAQQIAALNLKAELVFLSACYSGKGNVKQEGSIGPVWSFLGAGAKSTVATYWPLPDSATTFEMVESFYKEILNTDRASLNKAQVLRQVTLKAMEKNRDDFIQWGAFFLSGVSIDAKLD